MGTYSHRKRQRPSDLRKSSVPPCLQSTKKITKTTLLL
jgi:hypothetical protein